MIPSDPTVTRPAETLGDAFQATRAVGTRRFKFERDTFAFPNELVCAYQFDRATGQATMRRRVPPPTYAHHCFVLSRKSDA